VREKKTRGRNAAAPYITIGNNLEVVRVVLVTGHNDEVHKLFGWHVLLAEHGQEDEGV
jgi:hypothetical protein